MPSDIHAALGNVFHLYVTHHLSLSSCHIEDWAFSLFESFLFATICLKAFLFLLQLYNQKSQKHLHLLLFYLSSFLTNTFSSSWVRQPFLIERCYNWSPALGSHQDTFLAPLPGSVALLVRSLVRKLESWIIFVVLSHWYYGIYESFLAAPDRKSVV